MLLATIVWICGFLIVGLIAALLLHQIYLPTLARWLKLPVTFEAPRFFTLEHIKISSGDAKVSIGKASIRFENYRFKITVGKIDVIVLGAGVPPGRNNLGLQSVVGKSGSKLVEAMGKNLMRIVQTAKDLGVWKEIAEAGLQNKNTVVKRTADVDSKQVNSIWRGIVNNIESTFLMILFKTVIFDLSDINFKLCSNLVGKDNKLSPFNSYLKAKGKLKHPLIIGFKVTQPTLKLEMSKVEGFIITLACNSTEILSEDDSPALSLSAPKIKFNIMPTPVFSSPKLALLSSSILVTVPSARLVLRESLIKTVEGLLTMSLINSVNEDDSLHTVSYDRDLLPVDNDVIPLIFVPSMIGSLTVHFEKLTLEIGPDITTVAQNLKVKIKGKPKFKMLNIIEYYQEIKVKVELVSGQSEQSDFLTLKNAEVKLETTLEKKKGYERILNSGKTTVKVSF